MHFGSSCVARLAADVEMYPAGQWEICIHSSLYSPGHPSSRAGVKQGTNMPASELTGVVRGGAAEVFVMWRQGRSHDRS